MRMQEKKGNSDLDGLIIIFYGNIIYVKFEFLLIKNKRFLQSQTQILNVW